MLIQANLNTLNTAFIIIESAPLRINYVALNPIILFTI